jgi:glutamine synthetase
MRALSPERLRVLFCDHLNIVRGKYVPWRNRDGGARFCRGTFGVGYDKDLIPAPGAMVFDGLPDMEAVYQAEAARPGWEAQTRVAICDLHDNHGQPLPQCARGALKRAIADWNALGYDPMVGIELEAYAFQIEPDGSLKPYETPSSHVYATGPFADPRGFTDAIWAQAAACGLPIDSLNTEYDSPQFELTLTFDHALKAVDDIVLFRLMAREVAFKHGILLTFLPKPLLAQGGSGVHVNFSLRHRAGPHQGQNAISGGHDPAALNALTRSCIAGLMHHHGAIAGLAAPCVNSYERLKPATLSGYWQNWGVDHRNVTVRVSAEDGASARLEHRMGDGAANPYTLVATVLQAARLGLAHGHPLQAMETGDGLTGQDATISVAEQLGGALDALEADTVLAQAVGADLVANHVFMKRNEVEKLAGRDALGARDFYIRHI